MIRTIEQYEACKSLLALLGELVNDTKSIQRFNTYIIEEESLCWEICDDCAEVRLDCICHRAIRAMYDDDASF